jgi:hypothetical protein
MPPPIAGRLMAADLMGSERDRRHPHRRTRSAPLCGVSCGPRAFGSGYPSITQQHQQLLLLPRPQQWPVAP